MLLLVEREREREEGSRAVVKKDGGRGKYKREEVNKEEIILLYKEKMV